MIAHTYGKQVDSSDTNQGPPNLIMAPAIALSNRGQAGNVFETVRSDSHGALPMVAVGERVANALTNHHGRNSGEDTFVTATLGASFGRNRGLGQENELDTLVCGALSAAHGGADDNAGQAGHIVAVRTNQTGANGQGVADNQAHTLDSTNGQAVYALNSHAGVADADVSNRSHANGGPVGLGVSENLAYSLRGERTQNTAGAFGVRRLTPMECERLQGFPDNWTAGQSDSVRYRQLGNAVAVPVARWLGGRITNIR